MTFTEPSAQWIAAAGILSIIMLVSRPELQPMRNLVMAAAAPAETVSAQSAKGTPQPGAPSLPHDVAGTWVLDSYVSTAADGSNTQNFGPSAVGCAMFDGAGNFSMTVVRSDLPKFASNNREGGSPDENRAVVQGSLAYFGTYSADADGKGLTLHILGATLPNWIGTTQSRAASMPSHDRLEFTNASASGGGSALIVWRRKVP